jgi:Flp pilus assembly protein protease CpaA
VNGIEQQDYLQVFAAIILLMGIVTDLRYRKYPNKLFLLSSVAALVLLLYVGGLSQLWPALASSTLGFALMLPLFLLGVVGGGDLKLVVAFALCVPWSEVSATVAYSLLWGAIFGLTYILFARKFADFKNNLLGMLIHRRMGVIDTNKIPYTIPIFLGWLTHHSLQWSGAQYGI